MRKVLVFLEHLEPLSTALVEFSGRSRTGKYSALFLVLLLMGVDVCKGVTGEDHKVYKMEGELVEFSEFGLFFG